VRAARIRIGRIAGHSFLTAPISPAATVLDLGLNRGEFATGVIDRYGCAVIGLEPVPELVAAVPRRPRLTVEHAAITGEGEVAALHLNRSGCATLEPRLALPGAEVVEVPATTLAALLERHRLDRVALVKVDIEGAELPMIHGSTVETLSRVDQFTIEFHDFLEPGLADAVASARRRLRAAGFADFQLSRDNTDVLFVNAARVPFSRAGAAIAYKYPRGIARRLDRRARAQGRRTPAG
jgi:FkbM family methyltransferase